jgi:hypothetical protein
MWSEPRPTTPSVEDQIDAGIRAERWRALEAAFHSRGVAMRGDSRLTQRFADGTCDPTYVTPDDVVNTMCAVDFVYKHTLYGELVEETLRHVADGLHRMYPHVSWATLWDVVRNYAPLALKLQCLAMVGLELT